MAIGYEPVPINDVGLIDSFPQDRKQHTAWRRVILFIVFVTYYCGHCLIFPQYTEDANMTDNASGIYIRSRFFAQVASILTAVVLADFAKRTIFFIEERRHRESRHHSSWKKTMSFVFLEGARSSWLILGSGFSISFLLASLSSEPFLHLFDFSLLGPIFLCALVILTEIGPNSVEQSMILEQNKLNIGQGLAWSYYFGYLKILLQPPVEKMSIRDRILWYEEKHLVQVQMKKLIILIPESCYTPSLLTRDGDDDLEHSQHLKPLQVDRAGIVGRHYNNNVYVIRRGNETPLRCVAEMATPILTLWQMAEHGAARTGLSVGEKHQQMLLFCRTLEYIIRQDAQCWDSIHLHRFMDQDEEGNLRPLSSVLREIVEMDMARVARASL